MKTLILFFSLLFAKFDKDGPKIKDLALWVNKMPFDEIDGYTLISSKELVDKLTQILGPKKIKEFLKVKIQFLVNGGDNNGFITFGFCHGYCGLHNFHVYVNVKTNKVYVCETINEEELQRIWYGSKGKVEFNNLTKENMIHCDYSNAKTARIDWEKALNAIPKEIL